MKLFGRNFEGYARAFIICTTVLLIASGLCGVQVAILSVTSGSSLDLSGFFIITGTLELVVMALFAAAAVVILFLWLATAIASRVRRHVVPAPKDGVQRLFDDKKNDDIEPRF